MPFSRFPINRKIDEARTPEELTKVLQILEEKKGSLPEDSLPTEKAHQFDTLAKGAEDGISTMENMPGNVGKTRESVARCLSDMVGIVNKASEDAAKKAAKKTDDTADTAVITEPEADEDVSSVRTSPFTSETAPKMTGIAVLQSQLDALFDILQTEKGKVKSNDEAIESVRSVLMTLEGVNDNDRSLEAAKKAKEAVCNLAEKMEVKLSPEALEKIDADLHAMEIDIRVSEVQRKLDEALETLTPEERIEFFRRMQKQATEELPNEEEDTPSSGEVPLSAAG